MDTVTDVLARLTAERDRLAAELDGVERAIAALRQAIGATPATETSAPEAPAAPDPSPPPPGPYAGLGFYEAAAAYLATAGEPKTSREIADALIAGGFSTKAADFRSSARTMLKRQFSAQSFDIYQTETADRWFFRGDDSSPTS
jgi:hypothetical protein